MSLTAGERVVLDEAVTRGAELVLPDGDGPAELALTPTGRLRVLGPSAPSEGEHAIGTLWWPGGRPASVDVTARAAEDVQAGMRRGLRDTLAAAPEGARERVRRIAYAVGHMAPVVLYVHDRCYSNLGRHGALPGNSVTFGGAGCQLTALLETPVPDWSDEDACFVACLSVLLVSGPPVRAEEFNGQQLEPVQLRRFLTDRLAGYSRPAGDAERPVPAGGPPSLAELERLAASCARRRAELQADGEVFYRVINGLTLHKSENLMRPTPSLADVPSVVLDAVARQAEVDVPRTGPVERLRPAAAVLAARLHTGLARPGFRTAHAAFLHRLILDVAVATGSDVAMGRGPRTLASLQDTPDNDPGTLRTRDFYCCVVAVESFRRRFRDDPAGLATTLSAYSSRMRFNTWHYLRHSLGIHDRQHYKDNWFFAPTMPDITEWSDQHHTGHVQFGVRYAIRVPVGIAYRGEFRPGLYDLRLLRTAGLPFTLADLRIATAVGRVLGVLHEAFVPFDPPVDDFANAWYRQFHATVES